MNRFGRYLAIPTAPYSLLGSKFAVGRINQFQSRALIQRHFHNSRISLVSEEKIIEDSNDGENNDVENTGVILKEKKETILYFDHLMPLSKGKYDFRSTILGYIYDFTPKGLTNLVLDLCKAPKRETEDDTLPLQITKFTPIRRDGGAFVRFRVPEETDIAEFNSKIIARVNGKKKTGIFSLLFDPRCYVVKGTPWIEDLRRYPSPNIKILFEGPDLTQENLYTLFRRYGTIADIIPVKPDSKDSPKTATVRFRTTRAGVSARHCVTGLKVGNTVVHIQYEPILKDNIITSFIKDHSRIAIPLIIALLATVAVLIFDPIRSFFMEEKITQKFAFQKNVYVKQFLDYFASTRLKMQRLLTSDDEKADPTFSNPHVGWTERRDLIKNVKLWLEENVNTFIIVSGPRGSGKRSLVEQGVLDKRENVLYIDCENLIKARKETTFLSAFANEIGYYPIFAWLNTSASFIDLVVQGLTGQKSGLSESKETQVKNMLTLSINVIRDIALTKYNKKAGEACSEGRAFPKEEDYLQSNPDDKPVIVIDRYQASRKGSNPNSFVYKELADWAANLITLNIAHVIFITDDIGSVSYLSGALPTTAFKQAVVSDASESSSEEYVINNLAGFPNIVKAQRLELIESTKSFGGRISDLQTFIRRMKNGEAPHEALQGMIIQSCEQLGQLFNSVDTDEQNSGFTSPHAWSLIKLLAKSRTVSMDEIMTLPLLKSNPLTILRSMENAGIIAIVRDSGLIKEIKPAKPLLESAFKHMVNDRLIYHNLESLYLNKLMSTENAKIAKFEEEVTKFGGLGDNRLFKERLQYLASKLEVSTKIIRACEDDLKKLLTSQK
ncbi:hypothetical protein BVG19_g697 [[Candida] boidinii]|nr:hypothetical protein BVG19_g697 [[Candida] boidinii]OWB49295.1 hypothetical protein B5S27_g835 [[Candida] boidinii]